MAENKKTYGYAFTVMGPDGELVAMYSGQVDIEAITYDLYSATPTGGGAAGVDATPTRAVLSMLWRNSDEAPRTEGGAKP